MTGAKMKTPGDKNDLDKTFRYRDIDGEGADPVNTVVSEGPIPEGMTTGVPCLQKNGRWTKCNQRGSSIKGACWACIASDEDEETTTSPGRCPPSLLTRKDHPKLVGARLPARTKTQKREELLAGGWTQESDALWRKMPVFNNAEWARACDVGHAVHSVVRDAKTGVLISNSAPSSMSCGQMPAKEFSRPRIVDVCAEVDLDIDDQEE